MDKDYHKLHVATPSQSMQQVLTNLLNHKITVLIIFNPEMQLNQEKPMTA